MLKVDAEPGEVGFDPDRLQRVDAHFRSLCRRRPAARLDDRRDPARPGGAPEPLRPRRRRGRPAGRRRHALAHLLDDQADHLGRGDDALRAGRAGADRPGVAVHPGVRRRRGSTAAARRWRPAPCPAVEPIRVWHLLTHTAGLTYGFHHAHAGRRDVPGQAATSSARPTGIDLAGRLRRVGRAPAAVPARHRVELLGGHRRAGPGRRGRLRAAARRVLRRADLRPARHDRHRVLGAPPTTWTGWPRSTLPDPTRRAGPQRRDGRRRHPSRSVPLRRRRAGLHGRRLPPLHADAAPAAASSTACGCSARARSPT